MLKTTKFLLKRGDPDGVFFMKVYSKNSDVLEYVEIPEIIERDHLTLIIQPKDYTGFIELEGTIQAAKKEEKLTMNITDNSDNFQIRLEIFDSSNYLTTFRWMVEYKHITKEFSTEVCKLLSQKFALQHNQYQPILTKKADTFQNPENAKENNIPQHKH